MSPELTKLRMKNILLSPKEKERLIGSLSLEEKLVFASYLLDDEINIHTDKPEVEELDGSLSFGNKTYEDGMEIFTNNRE